jgi:hypothetical protein
MSDLLPTAIAGEDAVAWWSWDQAHTGNGTVRNMWNRVPPKDSNFSNWGMGRLGSSFPKLVGPGVRGMAFDGTQALHTVSAPLLRNGTMAMWVVARINISQMIRRTALELLVPRSGFPQLSAVSYNLEASTGLWRDVIKTVAPTTNFYVIGRWEPDGLTHLYEMARDSASVTMFRDGRAPDGTDSSVPYVPGTQREADRAGIGTRTSAGGFVGFSGIWYEAFIARAMPTSTQVGQMRSYFKRRYPELAL